MNFKLSADRPLTKEMIIKYLELNKENDANLKKKMDYYLAKHSITYRTMEDASKPNNKIVNPYAHYITDIMTGYFMGEPVKYNSKNDEQLMVIDAIFNYNDEAAENSKLAEYASIYGAAYEIMYLDDEADIRFKRIDTEGAIPIFENTIEGDLLYFIRYYDEKDIITGNVVTYLEVYSRVSISYYRYSTAGLEFIEEVPHHWQLVPINIYYNNEEQLGDFETVISEIDAYDKLESDNINEVEYFNDAYLALYGVQGTEADDIAAMKANRVLLFPEDAKAEWLTKSINDTYLENLKNRLDKNIHKFSYCPAMTDQDFSQNASGVAMKYKLMGLENATSKKESAFKVGLQRRLELICNMLAVKGTDYDYRAIDVIFTRNIPNNIVEMAEVINKIGHLYSEQTQMDLLPIEVDYEKEQERKAQEQASGYSIEFTSTVGEEVEEV